MKENNIRWVGQLDAFGCGLAVAAMLTGCSYVHVRDDFCRLMRKKTEYFQDHGITHALLDAYLGQQGFATIRTGSWNIFTKRDRRPWPRILYDVNYCEVEQLATDNWHFVVLMRDGRILDPLTPDVRSFKDYKRIASVVGVFDVLTEGL